MDNSYVEIKIKVNIDNLENIENIFYKLGRFELYVEDPRHLYEENNLNLDTYFNEDEILVDGKEICVVRYYISEKENFTEFLDIIKSMIRYENIDCFIETQEVLEEDWANNWKKYYHTFKIDNRVVIKPEWENYERLNDEILINIDPGMAFGTGTHETTKLCIQMMCKYMKDDYFVYDVGTGSGILGILAAKLNARKVIAIDLDKVSVSAAKYNVKLNNISNIEIIEGNLLDNMNEKGDIIVSNIIAEIICDLIPDVTKVLNEDGIFIISGIIDSKVNLIKNSLLKYNMEIINESKENGWYAFAVKIKGNMV